MSRRIVAASILSISYFVSQACATVLYEEDFEALTAGSDLSGQGGWLQSTTVPSWSSNGTINVQSGGIDYNSAGSTVNGGSQRAGSIVGGSNRPYVVPFSNPAQTHYFRYIVQFDGAGGTSGESFVTFEGAGSSAWDTFSKVSLSNGGTLGNRIGGGDNTDDTSVSISGFTPNLIVMKLTYDGGSGNYIQSDIWLNPSHNGGVETTPDISRTDGVLAGSEYLPAFYLQDSPSKIDSIMAATTWGEVVPEAVPEPGVFGMLGLGVAMVYWIRRRRRT